MRVCINYLYKIVVGYRNLCQVTQIQTETAKDSCSSALTFQKEGYFVDLVKSNLTQYSDADWVVQISKWYFDPTNSPDCYFYR